MSISAKLVQLSAFLLVVIGADASHLSRPVRWLLITLAVMAMWLMTVIGRQAH
ncbi:hypothetical protein [Roseicella frigidaeris]|uniref:hypothetical protein n=1 Tax=Roseicella frigidaeris TaxID=2230885 RepID=UPI001401CDE6|nr:hypothetical protein [Roseicella frigidaeris]